MPFFDAISSLSSNTLEDILFSFCFMLIYNWGDRRINPLSLSDSSSHDAVEHYHFSVICVADLFSKSFSKMLFVSHLTLNLASFWNFCTFLRKAVISSVCSFENSNDGLMPSAFASSISFMCVQWRGVDVKLFLPSTSHYTRVAGILIVSRSVDFPDSMCVNRKDPCVSSMFPDILHSQ